MAYHSSVGCDRRGDQPTGYATPSTCFHTPEITITHLIHGGDESCAVDDGRIIADFETYSESP
jgi:hypothetical protein